MVFLVSQASSECSVTSRTPHLYVFSAGIIGVPYHASFMKCWGPNMVSPEVYPRPGTHPFDIKNCKGAKSQFFFFTCMSI